MRASGGQIISAWHDIKSTKWGLKMESSFWGGFLCNAFFAFSFLFAQWK